MEKIYYSNEFFNIEHTIECGQFFRFKAHKSGYLVFSLSKCAFLYYEGDYTVIECKKCDADYFKHFFDLNQDYSIIYKSAVNYGVDFLSTSAEYGKGIRILNQDPTECLFSFIVSQNNNIPRIKGIIERLCTALGEPRTFDGVEYFAFPSPMKMSKMPLDFYKSIGLGYRAEYVRNLAIDIVNGLNIDALAQFDTANLKRRLIALKGVGPKVADCVIFFGFHRGDSFPVDTWIKKVYATNFKGNLTDTKKIADWFVGKFGNFAGYYQQYLFHYKRTQEIKTKSKN